MTQHISTVFFLGTLKYYSLNLVPPVRNANENHIQRVGAAKSAKPERFVAQSHCETQKNQSI